MRTTLDIDDDVLAAAKELAAARDTTAGQVISDLVRRALTGSSDSSGSESHGLVLKNGWYVLPSRGGPPVTDEMVDRLLKEADLEEAGIVKPKSTEGGQRRPSRRAHVVFHS